MAEKKIKWWLIVLSPIAIPAGFVIGFFVGLFRKRRDMHVVEKVDQMETKTRDEIHLDELLRARYRSKNSGKKWEDLTTEERAERWANLSQRRRRRDLHMPKCSIPSRRAPRGK
jgi:hypothetical protein